MTELGSKLSPHPGLLKESHAAALLGSKPRIPSVLGGRWEGLKRKEPRFWYEYFLAVEGLESIGNFKQAWTMAFNYDYFNFGNFVRRVPLGGINTSSLLHNNHRHPSPGLQSSCRTETVYSTPYIHTHPISNPLSTDRWLFLCPGTPQKGRKANTSEHMLRMMSVQSRNRAEYYSVCLVYVRS